MNDYALCELSYAPVRSKSDEASEMVTQILFGELARVKEVTKTWLHLELVHDNYTGWVDRKMVSPLSHDEFQTLNSEACKILTVPFTVVNTLRGKQVIPFGSILRKGLLLNYDSNHAAMPGMGLKKTLAIAERFINTPYLWGGRTAFGIDCSGFVQIVYRALGIELPRDASLQIKQGKEVKQFTAIKPGDLAFFGEESKITHVGIVTGKNTILHASGWVRTDTLDEIGINNSDTKSYSHNLVAVKRWL